ncbi:efflux transporter outer membrane subunit [Sphingobium sp.]|uniref:efflux transporter outer membrane subunit n=1 Tax=Sphingobium sp. TaxID=1912891 RepID=UPI002C78A47F|nr:efflux transporter outer membrane subunit [Sphingobium sp.]HUD94728.1 efflux transporter outer membrane subunit [Sphingobium sp.]
MKRRVLSAALVSVVLAGCVPANRPPPATASVAPPATWRDEASGPVVPVSADWWFAFGDEGLGQVVERALANNTDVLLAASRVEEAETQIRLAHAARLPTISVSGGGAYDQSLSATTGRASRVFAVQPTLDASWRLDLFGRLRALTGAARAAYVASAADRDATRLAVAAATGQAYVTLLSIDLQLTVTRQTLASRAEARRIAEDRARLGYSSQLELTQAQSEYEAIAQTIPQLEQAQRIQENGLRLLTGDLPGAVLRGTLVGLQLPPVPALMPSELMRRRPDIASAEARLVAADRVIAARRAEFLPDVALSASVGALFVDQLAYDPVSLWSLGGSILAPLFQGGRLTAQLDQANAQRDQAAFAYRGTVLTAFGEVENALVGEKRLREQIARAIARRTILQRSLTIARDRYRSGYSPFLDELDAQRNLYAVELSAISVREQQFNTLIGLWQALGGGWNGINLPTKGEAGSSKAGESDN